MHATHSDHDTLEHVEEVGFYSVIGIIAVGAAMFAGIAALAYEALQGVVALLVSL